MDDLKIRSLEDLYRKLTPALRAKVSEMERCKYVGIKEIDIWNYLKNKCWIKRNDLTLGEMVDDILNTPNDELINAKINNLNRRDESLL